MADKEAGLNIGLGVTANEGSVDQALNKIEKKISSATKGGRIDVTVPISIDNKNLTNTQKEVVDEVDKLTKKLSKGVSVSGKDFDTLDSKLNKFLNSAKEAGKDNRNPVVKAISQQVKDLQAQYKEIQRLQKVTRTYEAKVKKTTKSKSKRSEHYISDEEIEANIKQHKNRTLYRGVNSTGPRSYKRNSGFDTGVATSKTVLDTERGGSYPSTWAQQMAKSRVKSIGEDAATLKVTIDKELANKLAEEAVAKGGNKNKFTEAEKAKGIASAILPELAKVLGGIQHGREDASPEKFFQMLEAVLKLNTEAGMKSLNNASSVLNMTLHKWFNSDGTLGVGDGENKIDETRAPQVESVLKEMMKRIETLRDKIVEETKALEAYTQQEKKKSSKKTTTQGISENSIAGKVLNELNKTSQNTEQKSALSSLNKTTKDLATETQNVAGEVKRSTKATETQTIYDKNANVKSDTDMAKEIKVNEVNRDINRDTARAVKTDVGTGFNTDEKANELISTVKSILSILQGDKVQKAEQLALPPGREFVQSAKDAFKSAIQSGMSYEQAQAKAAEVSNRNKGKNVNGANLPPIPPEPPKRLTGNVQPEPEESKSSKKVEKSNIYASPIRRTLRDTLQNFINDITGASKAYKNIVNASSEEQDRMAAERVKIWGMNNGRNPNDTGDIAGMRRILELYRTNKASIESNPELMQKIKLTEGIEVDTTELTKALNKALSGKQMRNAQMGGSIPRQILGSFTGFIGMPSLEKSRAQADGLNQILGNINKALNSVLANIQMHETTLAGMEKTGEVEFDDQGYITKGSSSARKTLADLEESKYVLETIRADLLANEQIIKRTGNDYGQMTKQLSFTSPVLRDNNAILRNINAGLDKGGKALKFQTRIAEILNYTFQLISRSIGQWFKKIISMLNPLNIIKSVFKTITGWIKSAFQDFGSYDTKWQRTMNVIKINFQRAIKPAMEWIAQKLVNIIGFFNIISMKVQEAFGQTPVDLFDQAGANAEKMRRELEKAANVTAGFDELHDIGSDNSGENDLLGDIYKPQLSDEWKAMAEEIGDLFAGLIKGEKTIGEVFGRIFEMLLELLGKIAKAIWDWFKTTSVGKYLIDNWKKILATILAVFIGWQLLKIAGPMLLKAIFGKLMEHGVISGIFSKIGGWISSELSLLASKGGVLGFVGSFGQGIIMAFQTLFTGGKYSLLGTLKEMFTSSAAITEAGSWGSMIGFAIAKALGAALAGAVVAKGFDMVADDASYNIGLKENGGKDKDQKSGLGGKLLGAAGGAALAGLVVGGPIAMGVGAIVGLLVTLLAPAIEEITTKSKDMNNELQKIEYYEGAVKGAQTQVDIFDEQLGLLKESLKLSTDKVYDQGEKLGISKTRMDELVKATQDGTFTTDMLSGSEVQLSGSLTDLAQKQEHTTEVTKKLEEAQKKLLKAQTELSIAQDVEAGNFELAAARIELAEAQGVYSTDEATKKRIQIYKQGGEEERKNLLQNLTPEQRALMAQYNGVTDKETKELVKIWQESGDDIREAFLSGTDESVQQEFENNMNSMDNIIKQHQGFWQKAGDTIAEIFSFGNANTWTYNAEAKYEEEKKKGKFQYKKYDVGTNYVPNDGLAYLHQGEAVIPKKYNRPYQPNDNSRLESAIEQLNQQVAQIGAQVNKGIEVRGEFKQRGSDLVAVTERAKNKNGSQPLNNPVFAR